MVSIRLGQPDDRVSELYSSVPLRIGKRARMKLDKNNILNHKEIYTFSGDPQEISAHPR